MKNQKFIRVLQARIQDAGGTLLPQSPRAEPWLAPFSFLAPAVLGWSLEAEPQPLPPSPQPSPHRLCLDSCLLTTASIIWDLGPVLVQHDFTLTIISAKNLFPNKCPFPGSRGCGSGGHYSAQGKVSPCAAGSPTRRWLDSKSKQLKTTGRFKELTWEAKQYHFHSMGGNSAKTCPGSGDPQRRVTRALE